jgi:hypothetical protein
MKTENHTVGKSFDFAVRIVNLSKYHENNAGQK